MDLSRFFPPSLLDQSFGLCISPEDLIFPSYNFHRTNYYRPWKWYMQRAEKDFGSTINNEKDTFKIALDVQHFQPEEIKVKVADREIIIEGKHEEKQDSHGFISREFKRRYFLPHDCDADSVFSSLSSDGVLTITAGKVKEMKHKEIIVPIKMCDTCPNKCLNTKKEKMDQTESNVMKTLQQTENGTNKNKMEIMLKDDHCCLLRPELLGASIPGKVEIKKEKDDILLNTASETSDIIAKMKMTEKVDAACSIESAKAEKSEKCAVANTEISEKVASELSSKGTLEMDSCKLSSKSEKIASEITSMQITENLTKGIAQTAASEAISAGKCAKANTEMSEKIASGLSSKGTVEMDTCKLFPKSGKIASEITVNLTKGMAPTAASEAFSAGNIENVDTLLSGLTNAGISEKAETLLRGFSSTEKTGQIESVACGITSEVLSEKAETSASVISEMTSIKSMINETYQMQESSSSYSSSMASTIKETTEKISELVNDISAQLKEAAENI